LLTVVPMFIDAPVNVITGQIIGGRHKKRLINPHACGRQMPRETNSGHAGGRPSAAFGRHRERVMPRTH